MSDEARFSLKDIFSAMFRGKQAELYDAAEAAVKPTVESPLEGAQDAETKVQTGSMSDGKPQEVDAHPADNSNMNNTNADEAVKDMDNALKPITDPVTQDKGAGESQDDSSVIRLSRTRDEAVHLPKYASAEALTKIAVDLAGSECKKVSIEEFIGRLQKASECDCGAEGCKHGEDGCKCGDPGCKCKKNDKSAACECGKDGCDCKKNAAQDPNEGVSGEDEKRKDKQKAIQDAVKAARADHELRRRQTIIDTVIKVAKAKLGEGGRFKGLEKKLGKQEGVKDPGALAASIGSKKYGKGKMQSMAAKGSALANLPSDRTQLMKVAIQMATDSNR